MPREMPSGQANSFKDAIRRLFHELEKYHKLILTALILAVLGAILSILAPNQLSKITDKIAEGLVINTENVELITTEISKNFSEEKVSLLLTPNISKEEMVSLLRGEDILESDKEILKQMESNPEALLSLSTETLSLLYKDTTIDGETFKKESKIALIKYLKNEGSFPLELGSYLLPTLNILGQDIPTSEQILLFDTLKNMGEDASVTSLYSTLEQMPNIYNLVKPMMDIEGVTKIVLLLVCMYGLSGIFTYIQAICMTNASNKFAKDLRTKISHKINALPLKYFDAHYTGDTLSRVTNDVDMIHMSMNQSLVSLVSSITLFLGTLLMMFITNWILAITAILSSLIGFALMLFILRKSQKYFVERQEELGNLNGHIEEIYSGLNVVKVYNGRKSANEKFDRFNNKVCESSYKSQFLSGLMMPLMNFIGNFGYVMVCIVGALLTMNNIISFGVIVAFISYVRLFTSPLSQIAQAMTSLQSAAAASERVFEFLDEEEMASEKDITTVLNKENVKGNISFSHVTFQYDGAEKPTIKDFTAKALSGQKIAIVGPTGAGKTTMVNLLMKFYEINGGDILIDGISTKNLTRANIHDLFTMVLQDTWLFEGTIKENIVYNRKNVSDKEIWDVLKAVGLDHYVKTLSKGLKTEIGENDDLSAGEKQLLTIARGMISETPFLILDEATSNVDTRTEELVSKAMDELMKGKTSFIIAHRLSTIKNADLILVMKDGNIIEQGNHEELLKKKGFYAELYNSQFEL